MYYVQLTLSANATQSFTSEALADRSPKGVRRERFIVLSLT